MTFDNYGRIVIYTLLLVGSLVVASHYGKAIQLLICGASCQNKQEVIRTIDDGRAKSNNQQNLGSMFTGSKTSEHIEFNVNSTTSLSTNFDGINARAFDSWPENKPLPCFEAKSNWQKGKGQPANMGFIYLKGYKTGSSTSSGITLRIARNVARRLGQFPMCKARFNHAVASSLYSERIRKKTFMWTVVRNPTSRVVSQFFHFQVSRKNVEASDSNFVDYCRRKNDIDRIEDYYLKAFSLSKYERGKDDPVATANKIFEDYDFIGITERMNESALALAMLLRITIADILFLSAKVHGGYDGGGGSKHTCTLIQPSIVSEGMQAYLDSDDWHARERWDRAIFHAANRSLDLTIDRLGRKKFEKNLALYEEALKVSQETCLSKTTFPCSADGLYTDPEHTDCLWIDSGCGFSCLDEVADKLGLWKQL